MDKNKRLYIKAFIASLFGILCFVALALSARYLLISPDMSWQDLYAVTGLILGMLLLVIAMIFGWRLVLNRNSNKENQINFVENLCANKDKWPYIALFVVSIICTSSLLSSAISSWEVLSISDIEPWRFWFALAAFIIFVSLVIAGIIGCILCLVRIVQSKNKNQSSLS